MSDTAIVGGGSEPGNDGPPPPPEPCTLCRAARTVPFRSVFGRAYHRCASCHLVFMDPGCRMDREAERARYETHENEPGDVRYRAFLDRLAVPLAARVPTGAEGLDYGSGPGPTLSAMLEERGLRMSIYDPFFAPDRLALGRTYDFITCSETVEHFFDPAAEFARLDRLLRPGGRLAIMTGVLTDDRVFEDWWYVRDPTHVSFYTPATLGWIAAHHGWKLERPSTNVAIFRKRPDAGTPSTAGG